MTSARWQPLLSGEMAVAARQAVERIAGALPRVPVGYGSGALRGAAVLDGGLLGQTLFWAELACLNDDEAAAERAADGYEAACAELAQMPMPPTLYAGFLGPAWVGEYLQGRIFDDDEGEDPHLEVDEALLEALDAGAAGWSFDLVKGLTGCGVYALERWPRPSAVRCLERIVELLADGAVELGPGISWRTPPDRLPPDQRQAWPDGVFRLGLAHGTAGILAFLAAVCRAGVAEASARRLAERAADWLLDAAAAGGDPGACPHLVSAGGDVAAPALSWCSGNPGIAAGLLAAARLLGRREWEDAALELATAAARHRTAPPPDAGFCHGTAGIAHTFHRLYQATGDRECAAAARHWLRLLLESQRRASGETGFFTALAGSHVAGPRQDLELSESGGLMRGAAGIGLVLLAATASEPPGWDRVTGLDWPPLSGSG